MRRNRSPNYLAFFVVMLIVFLALFFFWTLGTIRSRLKPSAATVRTTQNTQVTRKYYTSPPRNTYQYIGNRRSRVYHRPTCFYVDRMNESNKVYLKDKAEARLKDFFPCTHCYP